MSFFNSSNNSEANVESWSYNTFADSGFTQGPLITFHQEGGGSGRRGNWIVDGVLNAGSRALYNFSDYVDDNQTGTSKTITLRTNKLRDLQYLGDTFESTARYNGNLDLSKWDGLQRVNSWDVSNSPPSSLIRWTGITFPTNPQKTITRLFMTGNQPTPNSGIYIDTFDLSHFKEIQGLVNLSRTLPGYFTSGGEPVDMGRTNIIWPTGFTGNAWDGTGTSTSAVNGDRLSINNCRLFGHLDFTTWVPTNGFNVSVLDLSNNSLSGVTFPATNNFMKSTSGFDFSLSRMFASYPQLPSGFSTHLDLSPLSGWTYGNGKHIFLQNNKSMTGVTWFGDKSSVITSKLYIAGCDIKDNTLDLFTHGIEVRSSFYAHNNTGCTIMTFMPQTLGTPNSDIWVYNTSISSLMLSGMTNMNELRSHTCPNLTTITLPYTTKDSFRNDNVSDRERWCMSLGNSDLGYVNFLPLSGATLDVNSTYGASIALLDNNMTAGEVNHVLVDFDNLSTNLNPSGWSGVTLDIGGTNATPDTTSGGFNGIAAIDSLTGITNNWSITTS